MPERPLPCCPASDARVLRDLDHVYGFDFFLFECVTCGKRWVHTWREEGIDGWENVTVEDAERMLTTPESEMRRFMKEWAQDFN